MSCASGCPERLRHLLLNEWGWQSVGGCGDFAIAKGRTEITNETIDADPTLGLKLAVEEELRRGRSKWDVVRDVFPALWEGLDATIKQNGIFAAMRAVAETMEKLVDGKLTVSVSRLISATISRRTKEAEPEVDEILLIEEEYYDEEAYYR